MGKKRHALIDESDLDSSSEASSTEEEFHDRDLDAENELFRDPYQSKRSKKRRKHGKIDALYGVFADDDSENPERNKKVHKHLHKPQIFVPSTSTNPLEQGSSQRNCEDGTLANKLNDSGSTSFDSNSETSDPENEGDGPTTDAQDDAEIDVQGLSHGDPAPDPQENKGRLGLGARSGLGSTSHSNAPVSNNDFRAFLGSDSMSKTFQSAGLGSKTLVSDISTSDTNFSEAIPVDADSTSLPRRSFLGAQAPELALPITPKKPLSRVEQQHFAKLASNKHSSMGLKLLEKMGWKSGTGLGAKGEGIVTPLQTKVRPKGMGLSYDGFKERTKQAEEEDRRNGKLVDDEEDPRGRKTDSSKDGTKSVREAWKTKAKATKKPKVVHRTYEEIISELAEEPGHVGGIDAGLGEIIDLTGRKLPSLSTTLLNHSHGPTEESKEQRLPELMHNLTLICDMAKANLINLANEGNAIKRKQEQLARDQTKSAEMTKIKQQKLNNMKKIMAISSKTKAIYLHILDVIKEKTDGDEICAMLNQFDEPFNELLEFFQDDTRAEYDALNLDEIAVCALAPILRRVWKSWDVLRQPHLSVTELKRFKKCFRLDDATANLRAPDSDNTYLNRLNGDHEDLAKKTNESRKMTAYESLIWNDWVPKIRSTVNVWSPDECEAMIELYVKWKPLLPQFVHDNFLDQLILPRLLSHIASWDFRERQTDKGGTEGQSLHLFVFPWLEHLGSYRNELLLQEVRLKLASWLKAWKFVGVEGGDSEKMMIQDLLVWKDDVFKCRDWEKLVLKNLVPNLAAYLKSQLIVNPKQQDLKPFQLLLRWTALITHHEMLDQLFSIFFAKWLETLWIWLVAGTGNPDQIGQWYNWWKGVFPEQLNTQVSAIRLGFARGLELMNQARSISSLGLDLKSKLEKPDLVSKPLIELSSSTAQRHPSTHKQARRRAFRHAGFDEVTFQSIVEEEATKLDLFLIPLGKSLESNGMSLYRVSRQYQTTQKNSGVVIYIEDDVVFVKSASEDGNIEWEPMAVDEMLAKASALSAQD